MNGTPDYAFFRIKGAAGDTFSVRLDASAGATAAGLGFETTPAPGTVITVR